MAMVTSPSASSAMPTASSSTQSTTMSSSDMTRRMMCGGIAGMVAKTATNPLERIKILSQTGEHGVKKPSIIAVYRNIIQKEGILGLWAGNATNLVRVVPAKAVVFSTNDFYRTAIMKVVSSTPTDDTKLPTSLSFLAGGLAGMTATFLTYPLDFARGRISGKLAGAEGKAYNGIVRTLLITIKDEGFVAMFRGVTPTIFGAIPYEGIKFGTVAWLEEVYPKKDNQSSSYYAIRKTIFGGLGGVMAGLITYPNDTIRRLLQVQGSRGTAAKYTGYFDCARQVVQQGGIPGLYRGLMINLIRMTPNAAVQFGTYEILKQWTKGWF